MSSKSGSDYKEYAKARNHASQEWDSEINQTIWENPCKRSVEESQNFWSYVKSKNKTNNSIPQSQKDDGRTTEYNLDKANSMNGSVFTREQGNPPLQQRDDNMQPPPPPPAKHRHQLQGKRCDLTPRKTWPKQFPRTRWSASTHIWRALSHYWQIKINLSTWS